MNAPIAQKAATALITGDSQFPLVLADVCPSAFQLMKIRASAGTPGGAGGRKTKLPDSLACNRVPAGNWVARVKRPGDFRAPRGKSKATPGAVAVIESAEWAPDESETAARRSRNA